uniref:Uncharacterized protein n=1 Tax=Globisporangium ultimum (strain ATCC 200006 / CBS 805.95 / DAOM BR144) TaxID=431595 RepID=K3WBL3_GLOUD
MLLRPTSCEVAEHKGVRMDRDIDERLPSSQIHHIIARLPHIECIR